MSNPRLKSVSRFATVAVVALMVGVFSQSVSSAPLAPAAQPMLITHVFDVNCKSLSSITQTYAKLVDFGTFSVASSDSTVELTFNGRIFVASFSSGTGAVFELRVDNTASTQGRARANLKTAEAGGGTGRQVSITGLFTGLPAGDHTASMWVRTSVGGAGSTAMVDPGCWGTDALIVKEYTPFGFVFLPTVTR